MLKRGKWCFFSLNLVFCKEKSIIHDKKAKKLKIVEFCVTLKLRGVYGKGFEKRKKTKNSKTAKS